MLQKLKNFLFKNTSTRQTIAKNTFWLTVSNFGGRFLKAGIIIYAARVLGTAGYGVFSYAVTLAGFMGLLMDPGINSILTRDAAKTTDEERYTYFSTISVIKVVLLAIGVSVIIFIAPYFTTLPGAKALLPIVAFIIMFDTIREFFMSLLRGIEKMEWEAGIYIFTNFGIVVFGFIFILSRPTAEFLGWGYVIGTALGAIAGMIVIHDYIKRVWTHFSRKLVMPILSSAWPFAITGALGLLLTNADILIISWMRTASDVGIYSAAIRIVQLLYLIPGILQLSTLPLFARLAKQDNEKFRAGLEEILSLIFLISIPLAIGGVIFGTQLMSFIFGSEFTAGGLAFKILMTSMVIDFPSTILANALFAYSHQKSLIITSIIGGASNVIFDLLLIPRFGIAGSAVATLIAQILSNAYLWHIMKQINPFEVLPRLKNVFIASAIMAAVGIALALGNLNVLINIVICTVLYLLVLKLLKEPLIEETERLLRLKG